MHYFMRKSFHQNQSESKDHYFLPDEDEKGNVQQNPSDRSMQSNEPYERLIINNFTQNAKIKIDITYEDSINTNKTKNKSSQYENKTKVGQNSPNISYVVKHQNSQNIKNLERNYQQPPTPIKNTKYQYGHSYDKTSDKTAKQNDNFTYLYEYEGDNIELKQNKLYQDRKNQRYFNTQVFYPLSPTLIKSPQSDNQVNHQLNKNTPFLQSRDNFSRKQSSLQGRMQISDRFTGKSLYSQPKQKSFCKISQFNLNDSINKGEQNSQNHPQSDKPFDKISLLQRIDRKEQTSSKKQFIVREEISEDFIQQKNSQRKQQLSSGIKSSDQFESEIAEQIQHGNSFFDKVASIGQIEELIIPNYRQQQTKINANPQRVSVGKQKDNTNILSERTKQLKQQNPPQIIYQNANQTSMNHSINTDKIQTSCRFDANEGHTEMKEINILQITISKQSYFPSQNVHFQQHVTFQDQNINTKSNQFGENKSQLQIQESTPGKWSRNKSDKSIDLRQYQTRPKTDQIIQIDNEEQNIDYPIYDSSNKMNSSRDHWQQGFIQESQLNSSVENEVQHLDNLTNSRDQIDKLSQIENISPRGPQSPSNIKNTAQKPLQQQFHQRYTIEIESTHKKQPSSLKYQSVISYSISPSPKNTPFNIDDQHQIDQNHNQQELANLSMTSSLQRQPSLSKQTSRTYQQLQKYKRLFKKSDTKNPQSPIDKQPTQQKHKTVYIDLNQSQQTYSKKSSSRNSSFIKVEPHHHHHHQQHCLNQTQPANFKFKDYSSKDQIKNIERQSGSRSKIINQRLVQSKTSTKNEWIKPKNVKVNLKDKTAEDLFTKHKNDFLNKLKHKQRHSKPYLNQHYSTSRSRQRNTENRLHINTTLQISPSNYPSRSRPLSPYIENITKRLSSPNTHSSICQHYKKHSKRDLRNKFLTLLQQDDNILLRKYYFSQDQLNQIFVQQILHKEINQIYWVQVVKQYGERKLQNLRLRSKSKYHPHQKTIIKQEQLLADTKRTYIDHSNRNRNPKSEYLQVYY